jgi:hypothetical protein
MLGSIIFAVKLGSLKCVGKRSLRINPWLNKRAEAYGATMVGQPASYWQEIRKIMSAQFVDLIGRNIIDVLKVYLIREPIGASTVLAIIVGAIVGNAWGFFAGLIGFFFLAVSLRKQLERSRRDDDREHSL